MFRGKPHPRTVTQAFASGRLLRLIPNQATALQKAHTQSGNCFGSSPIGQLPDWVTTICLCSRRKAPTRELQHKHLSMGSKDSSSIGQLLLEGPSQLSNCLPNSAVVGSLHSESILVRSEKGNLRSRITAPYQPLDSAQLRD